MALIMGNSGKNVLTGTSSSDEIWGYQGDDVLIGGWGDDTLNGGAGKDTMDGGMGDDTYIVDDVNDKVVEHANGGYHDTVRSSVSYTLGANVENLVLTGSGDINGHGNSVDNDIYGNGGDNTLWGLDGNDELHGGGGNDVLWGGLGFNWVYGGTGDDFYIVEGVDHVVEYAGQGTDTIITSFDYLLEANVENLIMVGSGNINGWGNELKNDITGNSADNVIDGGAGADTMRGGKGNDTYYVDQNGDVIIEAAGQGTEMVYSVATSYTLSANVENLILMGSGNIAGSGNSLDNFIKGNSGNNTLYGYGGNDTMVGDDGADTMYGGEGNDAYSVDNAGDVVGELANQGIDTVYVLGDLGYALSANVENLYLDFDGYGVLATGNALNNVIIGSLADNVIDGGLGQDWMVGREGNDTYYVDNKLDGMLEYANEGNDTVFSSVDYKLADNIETLSLAGGNAVFGTGNAQSNTIFGNAGNNVLNGGGGSDALSGLGGSDTFVFQVGQAYGDVVYEFDGNGAGIGDVLQFSGYGTAAQGATFVQQTATEWLITSADGLTQEIITLVGAPTIDATDYVFV